MSTELIDKKATHDRIGTDELFGLLSKAELRECGCHFDKNGEFYFTEEQYPVMAALCIAMRKFICAMPPVDAVSAVRCKECKHAWHHPDGKHIFCQRDGRKAYEMVFTLDDFCSYGDK